MFFEYKIALIQLNLENKKEINNKIKRICALYIYAAIYNNE